MPETRLLVPSTAVGWPNEGPDSAGERSANRNHRRWSLVDGVDDFGVVDPAPVRGGDPEVGIPQLALYDQGLRCLLDVLRGLGVLAAEEPAAGAPTDVLLARFERYLVAERGLEVGTVVLYSACVRRFMDGLPLDRVLVGLAAGDVTGRGAARGRERVGERG